MNIYSNWSYPSKIKKGYQVATIEEITDATQILVDFPLDQNFIISQFHFSNNGNLVYFLYYDSPNVYLKKYNLDTNQTSIVTLTGDTLYRRTNHQEFYTIKDNKEYIVYFGGTCDGLSSTFFSITIINITDAIVNNYISDTFVKYGYSFPCYFCREEQVIYFIGKKQDNSFSLCHCPIFNTDLGNGPIIAGSINISAVIPTAWSFFYSSFIYDPSSSFFYFFGLILHNSQYIYNICYYNSLTSEFGILTEGQTFDKLYVYSPAEKTENGIYVFLGEKYFKPETSSMEPLHDIFSFSLSSKKIRKIGKKLIDSYSGNMYYFDNELYINSGINYHDNEQSVFYYKIPFSLQCFENEPVVTPIDPVHKLSITFDSIIYDATAIGSMLYGQGWIISDYFYFMAGSPAANDPGILRRINLSTKVLETVTITGNALPNYNTFNSSTDIADILYYYENGIDYLLMWFPSKVRYRKLALYLVNLNTNICQLFETDIPLMSYLRIIDKCNYIFGGIEHPDGYGDGEYHYCWNFLINYPDEGQCTFTQLSQGFYLDILKGGLYKTKGDDIIFFGGGRWESGTISKNIFALHLNSESSDLFTPRILYNGDTVDKSLIYAAKYDNGRAIFAGGRYKDNTTHKDSPDIFVYDYDSRVCYKAGDMMNPKTLQLFKNEVNGGLISVKPIIHNGSLYLWLGEHGGDQSYKYLVKYNITET